jgi:hypothetical protein
MCQQLALRNEAQFSWRKFVAQPASTTVSPVFPGISWCGLPIVVFNKCCIASNHRAKFGSLAIREGDFVL